MELGGRNVILFHQKLAMVNAQPLKRNSAISRCQSSDELAGLCQSGQSAKPCPADLNVDCIGKSKSTIVPHLGFMVTFTAVT